jgi:hypothetical protein
VLYIFVECVDTTRLKRGYNTPFQTKRRLALSGPQNYMTLITLTLREHVDFSLLVETSNLRKPQEKKTSGSIHTI